MSKISVYPGTFDPLTNGHLDLIHRAASLFDSVIVGVAKSSGKSPLFDLDQRIELAQKVLVDYPAVRVVGFEGLLVDFAKQYNADVVIRGVRSIADFEYEAQMVGVNRKMSPQLETIFLTPDQQWSHLSSTLVRDIARHGGDVSDFVPKQVKQSILEKVRP
jgi:pantetheine-phosphate adenylyltransferase